MEEKRDHANNENFFARVYRAVQAIPYGKVASYGKIAAMAGNPRYARQVGYALHVNPDPQTVPCYRVVTKDGRVSAAFAFGGGNAQIALLENEGVQFSDGKVRPEYFI